MFIIVYLNQYIEFSDFDKHFLPNLQKSIFTKIYKIVESLIQIKLTDHHFENKLSNLLNIIELLNKHYQKKFIKNNYLHIVDFITKKINKKSISIDIIKGKIDKENFIGKN